MREPFDSANLYYPIAMFLAGIFATLPAPRCWWMAVLGFFLGERLYAFILLPETRAWLLFGIVVNILIFSWLPAALGAVSVYIVNHQFEKRVRHHSHNH
jgi:accessory gene regulator protein AgrB